MTTTLGELGARTSWGEAAFMTRVNAVVEGQAEETFIQECLARHLARVGVAITPRRVEFGRRRGTFTAGACWCTPN